MSYSISQLKVDLTGRLHGTSLNKVTGVDDLISRAGRQVLLDCDPQETRRTQRIVATFYDKVFRNPAPDDLKGNNVIDIRAVEDRPLSENPSQTYSKNFDLYKDPNSNIVQFAVEQNHGTKIISINIDVSRPGVLLDECDSLTSTSIWTGDSQVFNLAIDQNFKIKGGGSIWFSILGAGGSGGFPLLLNPLDSGGTAVSGSITGNIITPADLSTHEQRGSIFLWVYIESITGLSSIQLKWGSSATNYWTRSVTTGHYQPWQAGWNLLRFDWDGAVSTGSPVSSAVNYLNLQFTTTVDLNNIRVDSIYSKLPKYFEIVYYSKYIFSTVDGVWQETVNADTNTINLDTESYDLVLDMAEILALRQMQDNGISVDIQSSENMYARNLAKYKGAYKSEIIKPTKKYYHMPVNPRLFIRR